ncbi:OmpA family protein [Snodgrassella alvi]|uniref:OmpA family protein n=1 Tax=Snodgrassella alvi TaxID=1196083 RepID=UPI00352CBA92
MSKRIYYTLLLVWIVCLSLYFIWQIWDIYWVIKICLSILIVLACGFLWYQNQFWFRKQSAASLYNIPKSQRIILVAGDDISDWIESSERWRLLRDSMWIRVEDCAQLISIYQNLDEQNKIANGIFLILNPDKYPHVAALEQRISQWRQEIETIQASYKRCLPLTLGIHTDLLNENLDYWPENNSNHLCRERTDVQEYFSCLQKQLDSRAALNARQPEHLDYTTTSTLYLNQQWLSKYVIKNLLPEKSYRYSLYMMSCVWLNSFNTNQQAGWRKFEIEKTGFVSPTHVFTVNGLKNFPVIENSFVRQHYLSKGAKYLCYAIDCFLMFILIGTEYSFVQNKKWLQEVIAAHQQYIAIPQHLENERIDSIKNLKIIQQTLQDYKTFGEPRRMGFGLYHATELLAVINKDINSFQIEKQKKQIIRLDTTALFDVGQSQLKADAKLVLQGVLTWVQANPNKRVLIDGHTDNTGNAASNKTLSFHRAEAVRDWLVSASTFPEDHFTVQGYGDSKPIATNDDPQGRSKNRRVEITLVDMNHTD